MKIGLIDCDDHSRNKFPNIPLMKLSAWHKQQGDTVEWYQPFVSGHMDRVYVSKVFSFSPDYEYVIDADEVIRGGSGYCIHLENGKEVYAAAADHNLPYEIEHIYPDYSLYGIEDTAYGFLSRGCPRGCSFCHVKDKEGLRSTKVADLTEFWNGQKNINICDPNILACSEWRDLLSQLKDSGSYIDMNQGLDIRLMTEEKAKLIAGMKTKYLHFAWDRYEEKNFILDKFDLFKEISQKRARDMAVYVLCNYDTTFEQDLDRVYTLRDHGYWAYVMLYDKEHIPKGSPYKDLQRWVNNRIIFAKTDRFEDYKGKAR